LPVFGDKVNSIKEEKKEVDNSEINDKVEI
jgi:hypothetical protein